MRSRALQLANKSIDCMVSAIEIYNKPGFIYREELFCILAINSWEMLLKAKILKDNNNNLSAIQVRDYILNKKGEKSKKWKYKESRSKNKMTLDIFGALRKLKSKVVIDTILSENLETLVEIRDNAIHFYNKDSLLAQKIQEIGTANIKSYLIFLQSWFSINLEKYNFYLMPMSFFHEKDIEPVFMGEREQAINNLLNFIAAKEKKFPSDPDSPHNITISIVTRMVKSNAIDAKKISITNDPAAPEVRISVDDIQKTHPLDYKELTTKLRTRYSNFKENGQYHEIRKILEENQKYCYHYPLNPKNLEGQTKQFYSSGIFEEFDKHYKKKI